MEEELVKRSVGLVTATVESNCRTHGIRGILNHSDILKMISLYDDEDKNARVFGKFAHLVGLVFKKFSRKIHVIKPFNITRRDYIVCEALDPHPRNPDAVMWLATDRKGTKFVVDELYGNFITAELARRIQTKADRYRIEMRIADPSAFVKDQHQDEPDKATLAMKLSGLGLDYQPATKDRQGADRRIKDALDYEMRGDEMLNAPELYVFDTCMRTIWELEHYQWDDWRGKAAERKDPKEKPQDKDDHMIECAGRLLLQEPAFVPMVAQQDTQHNEVKTNKQFDPFD